VREEEQEYTSSKSGGGLTLGDVMNIRKEKR
jgi:ribosome-binding protein aMBF1 (putative translation factor)